MTERRSGQIQVSEVVVLLVLAGLAVMYLYNDSKPHVFPRLRGQVEQPFLGGPVFVVTAFHQHPGNLRKGTLQIEISGPLVRDSSGRDVQKSSFELWEPNEEHAVILRFPLREYDPAQEIPVNFSIRASGIKDSTYQDAWSSKGWKSNQK